MGMRMLGNGIVDVDCPQCGKSNVYHVDPFSVNCKSCKHEFPLITEWERSGYPKAKGVKYEPLSFLNPYLTEANILSNDVYVSGSFNKVTKGIKPLGGRYVGQKSPIIGNDTVIDYHGYAVGRIDGNGYFNTKLF